MKKIIHKVKEFVPEKGDKFYFRWGINGFYKESVLGRVYSVTEKYQAYELRPMGCHFHNDGCPAGSSDHKIVTRKENRVEVFNGQDSIHKYLDFRRLAWNKKKKMWYAGQLS